MQIHQYSAEPWKVSLVDAGAKSMTGGRLKQINSHLDGNDFYMIYGDGLSDVNINKLIQFHQSEIKLATVTAVLPPCRFGNLNLDEHRVIGFEEKHKGDEGWINGSFLSSPPKF
jgi:glucose-1-phosphate cytidylyltransferase